jgi:glycosyltransferase involved in cell wall biosynthesis
VGIQSKRKELGLNLNGKIIGIVARLVPVKNHKVLIEAMRIVCSKMNTCLLVVGDGELRGSLEELASQAGLKKRILFLGNRNDVDEILQDLDLFVLPSISEGFPISILEAMAAGVPIVANAVGGIPEALEQGRAGLLINCRDPQGLAQGIIDLLIDSSQASSFREAAMRRVTKDFSLGVMAGKYSDIYKELVEKREMT